MTSKEFTKLAIQTLTDSKNYSDKLCPDDVVGYIKDISEVTMWFSENSRKKYEDKLCITEGESQNYDKTMVIILESPHINEFDSHRFIHPALGSTGKQLDKYFPQIFKWVNKYFKQNITWRVILMNAIQYQCSLGVDTCKFRDAMWLKLWFLSPYELRKSFISRLSSYSPDVIFNFCTHGKHYDAMNHKVDIDTDYVSSLLPRSQKINSAITTISKGADEKYKKAFSLRECVAYEIQQHKDLKAMYFEGNHPRSWYSKKSRIIIKESKYRYSFNEKKVKKQ